MPFRLRRLARTFVAGMVAALPLVATLVILTFTVRFVVSWLGPGSALGRVLGMLGVRVAGSELAGYAIGLALVVAAILALGLLAERGLQRGFEAVVEAFMQRIPIVRNVYDTIDRFVAMLSRRDGDGLRSMSPVWCQFGGAGGATVLGLLSSPQSVEIGGQRFRPVLIPTAPVPIGGALIYVPEAWVTPAQVGMEALTSIYVSMGVTSGEYLGAGGKR
ncbi:MAG TPA: DUF502 domain-containing protein [Myxococcota bacterium]|nr:DUF502 domain-containing protein [Myxococcota bacterium]